jgi:AAA+ superfamily predicted ATPase
MAIKKPCIQIRTNLEKEVFPSLINLLYENDIDTLYRIDELDKVEKLTINQEGMIIRTAVEDDEFGPVQFNPAVLLIFIRKILNSDSAERSAFIFMDYDSTFERPTFRRWIKDIFELRNKKYAPFFFISSIPSIPDDLNHLFSVVYYDTPTQEEIIDLLGTYEMVKDVDLANKEDLAYKFIGFTRSDIIECLDYSFYKYDKVDDSYIRNKRIDVIQKSSVLSYKEPSLSMSDMAGNKNFKLWYEETKYCFDPDAKKYGVSMPKGYLALGAPGMAKSVSAEAIANDLGVPMLMLDMSKLLSKFVGESERNIDQAVQLIKQVAPCVLLIDEVEKALGGYKSSNASDSGTLARVFGKVLNLLADNDNGIYTIMTSNNVKDLPPELTRAGRLDAIFYFDYFDVEGRVEIFDLHFRKRGHNISKATLKKIAKETKNYTGAEIEQIVINAIKKAFVRMKKSNKDKYEITYADLLDAKNNVIPVAVSSKEQINELEDWVKGRALYANKSDKEKTSLADSLDDLNIDDII